MFHLPLHENATEITLEYVLQFYMYTPKGEDCTPMLHSDLLPPRLHPAYVGWGWFKGGVALISNKQ